MRAAKAGSRCPKSAGGPTVTEPKVLNMIESLRQAGHLAIGDKDAVNYRCQG